MNDEEARSLARALGATEGERMEAPLRGPLDVVALREELGRRLRSTGGRPTDPGLSVSRQVRFSEVTWERLRSMAEEVGISGPRVGPAQVASLLIESSLEDESEWYRVLHGSREHEPISEHDAASAAGVSYRQMDDWYRRGWLVPVRRVGRIPEFSVDEVLRARWLRTVTSANREAAAVDVRRLDMTNRYLVTIGGATVTTARTSRRLLDLIEQPGGHLVIDQLAERRGFVAAGRSTETQEVADGNVVRRVG